MAWGGGSVLGQARGTCAEMSASGGDGPLWGWGSAWRSVTLWGGVSGRQVAHLVHLVHLRLVSSRPFLKERMGEREEAQRREREEAQRRPAQQQQRRLAEEERRRRASCEYVYPHCST
jgi:hypothetical protein